MDKRTQGMGRRLMTTAVVFCMWLTALAVGAQETVAIDTLETVASDTLELEEQETAVVVDSLLEAPMLAGELQLPDTLLKVKARRDWNTWKPDPKRAMWLGLVFPGAGQIYNRKYWKLPLVYGGFVGAIYAFRWNNQMYKDYAQAYLDIMDDDPNTHSYDQFLHLNAKINASNTERYKNLFKSRKDRYRRWRDMSGFVMIGIYVLSVIDAYVDASLSDFDISDDLSMSVAPAVMGSQTERNSVRSSAVGVNCSLKF